MEASGILSYWWVLGLVILLIILIASFKWFIRLFGILIIPDDSIGIVTKKFVLFGKHRRLPDGSLIALNGEAGIQADTLAPGLHWGYWPWQYRINIQKFITINEGMVGVVESRDGQPIQPGHVFAKSIPCGSYQDARQFLTTGGQRGPQLAIIPPGTYRINTSLFSIEQKPALEIEDNMVGVVTTRDGKPLKSGDIAGEEIEGHNMFQDGQAFIDNGGYKGLQTQVMLAGRYFINPYFITVETKPMFNVPIANVGVVIAYVGKEGKDLTGDSFKHGNLVAKGEKGVWLDPLDPGMYPINPYTHRVECVPTANIVLNWATGRTEAHQLDKNLSTITVRSSDGFTFNLDVSQIIHIPRNEAPKVIARFGSVQNLVTQVLEPIIGNYFRNAAQGSDAIDFLKSRLERQKDAKAQIEKALGEYNVGAVDTLIGDINPPAELMKTLTDRKIAEQQKITYGTQRLAEETRKELQQASATADTQANVVKSQREVEIAEFNAQSAVKKAEGEAKSKKINAEADANVLETVGAAKGKNITAIGQAEADVIRRKTEAQGQDQFAVVEVAKALSTSPNKFVPEIVFSGSQDGKNGGNTVTDMLLANLLLEATKGNKPAKAPVSSKTETKANDDPQKS